MPRGRTRDEDARIRILDAAFQLVGSAEAGRVTINDIADAANVAKQTIYRWWPSRTAVVLDALVQGTMRATPFDRSDDVKGDVERHLRSVIKLFNSPTGHLIRELLGEMASDEEVAEEFRNRFWGPRRDLSRARLERGVELGQVRDDVDLDLVLDAVYGPLWTRLVIGHQPMRASDAAAIVEVVWGGLGPNGNI